MGLAGWLDGLHDILSVSGWLESIALDATAGEGFTKADELIVKVMHKRSSFSGPNLCFLEFEDCCCKVSRHLLVLK